MSIVAIVLVGSVINVIACIQAGKSYFSIIVGTVMLAVILSLFGSLGKLHDIAVAFAVLYLISSLVLNGQGILKFSSNLLNGAKK